MDHDFLMNQIKMPKPALKGLQRAIKAGVRGEFPTSESGTPQGGVISPLLANIAINGLEDIDPKIRGIRYADDLVFILKPGQDAEKLRAKIDSFLTERGLKVKEAKTKLVKATKGFDFLGWNFKVKDNGKFISVPSQKNYDNVRKKIKAVLANSKVKLESRINRMGSIVRGWRNYHRYCDMSQHPLWHTRRRAWKKINSHKSYSRSKTEKAIEKAFPSVEWKVNRFVKVKEDKSPYDGDMAYWAKRENKLYDGPTAIHMRKQDFRCAKCLALFMPGDSLELHHRDGDHANWKSSNLEVTHRECHHHMDIHVSKRVATR
ncbi:MAG: group II intron reverse transcriptase [Xenococcaceae cyanobacterium]